MFIFCTLQFFVLLDFFFHFSPVLSAKQEAFACALENLKILHSLIKPMNFSLSQCTRIYFSQQINFFPFVNFLTEERAPNLIVTNPGKTTQKLKFLPLKFDLQCSFGIHAEMLLNPELANVWNDLSDEEERKWILFLPGNNHHTFHFFLQSACTSDEITKGKKWREIRLFSRFLNVLVPNLENAGKPLKMYDFKGELVRFAVLSSGPNDEKLRLYKSHKVYDFLPVLMVEMSEILNGSAKVVHVDLTYGFGRKLKDGKWDGYIGAVLNDQADISVPFGPFVSQYKAVGISKGAIFSPFDFFSGIPQKKEVSLVFLLLPFTISVWLALIVSVLANVITLQVLSNFNAKSKSNFEVLMDMVKNTTYFVSVLIDQPIPNQFLSPTSIKKGNENQNQNETPDGSSLAVVRIIFIIWLLSLIVIGNLYKSIVISVLVHPVYLDPPRTVSELIKSDFHINFVFYKRLQYDKRLEWVNRLKYPVTDYGFAIPKCLQSIREGQNVCFFVHNYLYLEAPRHLVDSQGRIMFLTSKDSIQLTVSFFGVTPYRPQLKYSVDKIVDFMLEGGVQDQWQRLVFHQRSLKTVRQKRAKRLEDVEEELEDVLVDKKLMLNPIILLASGCLIGLGAFVYEIMRRKWTTRGNLQPHHAFHKHDQQIYLK